MNLRPFIRRLRRDAMARTVLVCENELHDGKMCGRWMVVSRGELPTCPKCKRGERHWRVVTEAEIRERDDAFLDSLRVSPNDHLGATERPKD